MSQPVNFYNYTKKSAPVQNPNYGKTHALKVPFRASIIAASGAGKTNTILNIIQQLGPTFCKIVLCIPEPNEPLYDLLKEQLGDKLEIFTGELRTGRGNNRVVPNIPALDSIAEEDAEGWRPVLMIFDDLLLYDDQTAIEKYYIRGRKKGISSIYASQSFYKIPITIRRNCSYFFLKRNVLESDLKKIFRLASLDLTFTQFLQYYRQATSNMQDFLMLDLENSALYQNFNTEPVYSTYGKEEKQEIPPDIPELNNTQKHTATRDMGIDRHIDLLKAYSTNSKVPLHDIYKSYVAYAEANNFPVAVLRFYSKKLGLNFTRYESHGITYFYI